MNLSFKQYRAIDLTILGIILLVSEFVTATAAAKWFPGQLYALSPTITVVCIVMMRWNGYAAIHALLGGFAYCFASGAQEKQIIVYCVGNCFALAALALFKAMGKEKIRSTFYFTLLFVLAAFFGAELGRWLIGLAFGEAFDSIVTFLLSDLITLIFTVVVVLITRRVDGLFEDQKSYLIRTEEERRKAEAEKYYK